MLRFRGWRFFVVGICMFVVLFALNSVMFENKMPAHLPVIRSYINDKVPKRPKQNPEVLERLRQFQ